MACCCADMKMSANHSRRGGWDDHAAAGMLLVPPPAPALSNPVRKNNCRYFDSPGQARRSADICRTEDDHAHMKDIACHSLSTGTGEISPSSHRNVAPESAHKLIALGALFSRRQSTTLILEQHIIVPQTGQGAKEIGPLGRWHDALVSALPDRSLKHIKRNREWRPKRVEGEQRATHG